MLLIFSFNSNLTIEIEMQIPNKIDIGEYEISGKIHVRS